MKFTKRIIKTVALMLLISATACKQKYPDLGEGLFAEFVTSKDTMVVKLFYNKAPLTVSSFVGLSEGTHPMLVDSLKGKPYYNGTVFHRVINNFMIQGGDPSATGSGSPGFKFGDEFDNSLTHDKAGILSMANSGPGTNGSQFFITHVPTPWLDDAHTIFGAVQSDADQDIVNEIAQGDVIETVTIEGDTAALLASVEQVADWNEAMGEV